MMKKELCNKVKKDGQSDVELALALVSEVTAPKMVEEIL